MTELITHDKFFKKFLHNVKVAKSLFECYLPNTLKEKIKWDSLRLQPESFIDADFQSKYTDVLYKAHFGDDEGYIYVLTEHQSRPDRWMPFRIWHYLCKIWQRDLDQSDKPKKSLPIICPITLYHGKRSPYPFSMDFFKLFKDEGLARDLYLDRPFKLVDLTVIPDEELLQHGYVAAMEMIQKHVFHRDMLPVIQRLADEGILKLVRTLDQGEYVLVLVQYSLEKGECASPQDVLNSVVKALPDDEDKIMTGAEVLRLQGMQQGMQQGIEQKKLDVARKMMEKGMDRDLILEITEMSSDDFAKIG